MREEEKNIDWAKIAEVKRKLKTCKEEWLETKPGAKGGKYLGVSTVRQILDHAVEGVTSWDFIILREWKEDVTRFDKDKREWVFDGHVFHVRGALYIPGIGRREQYGCKVANGGKEAQEPAFKAAASSCLVKCASLFGVGEEIYSKFKIEIEEEARYEEPQRDITTRQESLRRETETKKEFAKTPEVETQEKKEYMPAEWDTKEIERSNLHRARLKMNNEMFVHYIRDFLKKREAQLSDINPANLKRFNDYLDQIVV